jgi:sigma-B regulation protein RsbU (phosphoserine phosphatase)
MFVGILDLRAQKLRYVNAGHNTQFALHRKGQISRLESSGRPIGLMPGGGYRQQEVSLEEGDCLFLYTDGLVDCENASGDEYGEHRLEELLIAERESPLETVLARVEEEVGKHRDGVEAADDATMVVLRVGEGQPLHAMKIASVSE